MALEAWTGSGWATLMRSDDPTLDPGVIAALRMDSASQNTPTFYTLTFQVPDTGIPASPWAGQAGRWMRLRLISGGYGSTQVVSVPQPTGGPATFNIVATAPPRLHAPRISFVRDLPPAAPQAVVSENDWTWRDHGAGLNLAGQPFQPFVTIKDADVVPTLYLGFDGGLPAGMIGLDFDLGDDGTGDAAAGPDLEWQYYDGSGWQSLDVVDGTADLTGSGVVRLNWPDLGEPPPVPFQSAQGNVVTIAPGAVVVGDDGIAIAPAEAYPAGAQFLIRDADGFETAEVVRAAAGGWLLKAPLSRAYNPGSTSTVGPVRLARFGAPRSWVRARPAESVVSTASWPGQAVNAVRAHAVAVEQIETHTDELLGPSNGAPGQFFLLRYHPVIGGEEIEVSELSGGRAAVEWAVLRDDVLASGGVEQDLSFDYDPATGKVATVWVRWRSVDDFSESGPHDRVYTIDETLGQIVFGDGQRGMIPPAGANAVQAAVYRAGGGRAGNVPAGAISQLLGPIPAVQSVINPRPTSGGADGETLELTPPTPVTAQGVVGGAAASPPPPPRDENEPIIRFLSRRSAGLAQARAAITPADYAGIALEASAGIDAVICLRADEIPGGPTSPGTRLRLVVLAEDDGNSSDLVDGLKLSQPLVLAVTEAVESRAPAWVAGRVEVTEPSTIAVDVQAEVVASAQDPDPDALPGTPPDPVAVRRAAEAALIAYLDPRNGGPDGNGWKLASRRGAAVTLSRPGPESGRRDGRGPGHGHRAVGGREPPGRPPDDPAWDRARPRQHPRHRRPGLARAWRVEIMTLPLPELDQRICVPTSVAEGLARAPRYARRPSGPTRTRMTLV